MKKQNIRVDERCAPKSYTRHEINYVFNSIVDISFFPLPASLRYNLHIILYTFKVYKVLTWYPYLLQNHIAGISSCRFVLFPFNITTGLGAGLCQDGFLQRNQHQSLVMKIMMEIRRRAIFEQAELLLNIRTNARRALCKSLVEKGGST